MDPATSGSTGNTRIRETIKGPDTVDSPLAHSTIYALAFAALLSFASANGDDPSITSVVYLRQDVIKTVKRQGQEYDSTKGRAGQ